MEPQERIGLAQLTKMAFDGVDLHPLQAQLLGQCIRGEANEGALMDLSVIEQLNGNRETGLQWQQKALKKHRAFCTNRRPTTRAKLLVFAAPSHIGGNTPVEFLLRDSDFEIITYYPDPDDLLPSDLPDHDVSFCAIPTDAEEVESYLNTVSGLVRAEQIETINLPMSVTTLDRDSLAEIFPYISGLRFPRTLRANRQTLETALQNGSEAEILAKAGSYPFIVRPLGSHAGMGLAKIDNREAFRAYLTERPEDDFFVSEFVNYASPKDGLFRKYRVVFVDGVPFPCHMAVSNRWDLWYMNAGMENSAAKRLLEAAFMDNFEQGFASRHRDSFRALTDGIDLDYFGIDCAEDAQGNLVVFEADNALIVHDMDPEAVFPYKRPHMQRIFAAFEALLQKHRRPDPRAGFQQPYVASVDRRIQSAA